VRLSECHDNEDEANMCAIPPQMAEFASRGARGNGIMIREAGDEEMPDADAGAAVDAKLAADIDYARQVQAKLDAEEARGGNRQVQASCGLCNLISCMHTRHICLYGTRWQREEPESTSNSHIHTYLFCTQGALHMWT